MSAVQSILTEDKIMKKKWIRSTLFNRGGTSKLSRVIRTTILLFAVSLQISAKIIAQSTLISVKVDDVFLTELFKEIQKSSDFDFFYKPESVPNKKVTLDVQNTDIKTILKIALKETNLDYKIVDSDIVIFEFDENNPHKGTLKQERIKVAGNVKDETGTPLPGVNVFNKADPTHGVITDVNGNFSIEVESANAVLVFSYIGFHTEERTITESVSMIEIVLKSDIENIEEVVITALGIRKEEKVLGYAVQQVDSKELKEGGNPNVISAMQGKVAGVEINSAATGLGGSNKITIRGNSSIAGNNDPLWIVDGVPFNNNSNSGPGTYGGYDRGSAAMDLNMDDIESVSVLKGPSAAALYGSQAGNGVIIVTTKRGAAKKGLGIEFSSTITIEDITETLEMQNKYGRGFNGEANTESSTSWGDVMDGSSKEAWNGGPIPYSPQRNRMNQFFETGVTQNYTLAIGASDEKRSYRFGTSYLNTKGMIDNQKLERYNLDISGSTKLSKYMAIDSKVSLARNNTQNRTYYGTYGVVNQLLQMPRNIRLEDLDPYYSTDHQHINWTGGAPTIDHRNPYYLVEQYKNEEMRDRVFGYARLKFTFNALLNVAVKQSLDYYHTKFEDKRKDEGLTATGTEKSFYSVEDRTYNQLNTEMLITGQKLFQLPGKLDFSYIAGLNRTHYTDEEVKSEAQNLYNMDFNLGAGRNISKIPSQSLKEKEVQSAFGSVQFYYNSFINLEVTARNDWSSALPEDNNSYFYPSVNLGFIGTGLLDPLAYPKWLSFAKLRLSWAQVGKDCAPHQLENTYGYSRDQDGNIQIIPDSETRVNENLKPELTTSREIGADLRLFSNRFGIDFTYYDAFTENQILKVDEVKSSSFKYKYINAGKISNKGIELSMNMIPVKTKDFTFKLDVNYAQREDYVDELDPDNSNGYQTLGENDMIKVIAKTGAPLGQILAKTSYAHNENGDVLINEFTGLPQILTGKEGEKVIGDIQPDWTGSVRISLEYKNVSLAGLFNVKKGGEIVSLSESIATYAGTSKRTSDREDIVFDGVLENEDGSYSENNTLVTAQRYFRSIGNMGGVAEEFIYDASFIKFGELSLSYTLGERVTEKLPIAHLTVSIIGRNLGYLYKDTPGTSPEVGFDLFSQAHDFSATPYTRSFGFSIYSRF